MNSDYLLNDDFFNFEKLRLNESRFRIETETEKKIVQLGLRAANQKSAFGITAIAGSGCRTSLKKLISTFNGIHYFLEPGKNEPLANILVKIVNLEIPPDVANLNKSKSSDIIESIRYLFENVKSKRRRLIVIYNLHNLRKSELANFAVLCKKLKDVVGIIFTIDEVVYTRLCSEAVKNRSVQDFLQSITAYKVPGPQPEEFSKLLIQRGILSRKIIDQILKGVKDFHSLNKKIEEVKEFLRKRGRL